jgi:hypothetical protein
MTPDHALILAYDISGALCALCALVLAVRTRLVAAK